MHSPQHILISCIVTFTLTGSMVAQSDYVKNIEKGRKAKNKELRSKRHSPLLKEDRKRFDRLNYFKVDPAWKKDAMFMPLSEGDTMAIMTSSGKAKTFVEFGLLTMDHLGDADTLTAFMRVWPEGYEPPYEPYLFVPFTDLSTGESTYGGGRYLDIDVPEGAGKIKLDFNLSYNPYCAYGDGFSCPIPPKKNFLDIYVEAGERKYGEH